MGATLTRKLTDRQRQARRLRYGPDGIIIRTVEQVAVALDVDLSNAKKLLSRAARRMAPASP